MIPFKNRSNYERVGFAQGNYPKNADEYGYSEVHGKMVVCKTGESNRYEMIQQAIPETSLTNIINRLMKGDTKAVGDVVASYVDATTMPKTLQEAQNLMIFSERYFDTLPVDVRKKYANDLGAFLRDVDIALAVKNAPAPAPAPKTEPITEVKE